MLCILSVWQTGHRFLHKGVPSKRKLVSSNYIFPVTALEEVDSIYRHAPAALDDIYLRFSGADITMALFGPSAAPARSPSYEFTKDLLSGLICRVGSIEAPMFDNES